MRSFLFIVDTPNLSVDPESGFASKSARIERLLRTLSKRNGAQMGGTIAQKRRFFALPIQAGTAIPDRPESLRRSTRYQ
jgi:hypothetical protein